MLDQLKLDVELIKKDITEIKDDLKAMLHSLHGNGKKGMIDRLGSLEFKVWVIWGLGVLSLTFLGHYLIRHIP